MTAATEPPSPFESRAASHRDAFAFAEFGAGYTPKQPAVSGVSGGWPRRRLIALLGPNGAGKSTLLRAAMGLLRDTSGKITLAGHDPRTMPPRARAAHAAYLPQATGLRFAFTARQVVAMGRFGLNASADAHSAAVDHALRQVDLMDRAEQVFAELSGGQQRRALIARAFAQAAHDQAVALLADEPTDGLDLKHAEQTMAQLRGLAHGSAQLAVVSVLHDLNLAARYADDAWLMHNGVVVAAGPVREVLQPAVLEPVYGVRLKSVPTETSAEAKPAVLLVPDPPD